MQKILTISIAAYQVGKYIRNTLDSLLGGDLAKDLEIFVIDDGGKDETLEIAKEYAARYPETVIPVHKENGGYGSTLNYGILHATGRYFRQLDGDDWFQKINMRGYLDFLAEAEADLVLTPYNKVYMTGKTLDMDRHRFQVKEGSAWSGKEERPGGAGIPLSELKEGTLQEIHLHELAIRTDLLKEHGVTLSEKLFYTDNEYVFFPLLYAETITRYPAPIYCYRMGDEGQSVSLQGRIRHWTDAESVLLRLAEAYRRKETGLSAPVKACLTDQLCRIVLFQMGNYIVYPDAREAFARCRAWSEKLRAYPALYEEACRRYTMVRGLVRGSYPVFAAMRLFYKKRVAGE
ncbi:MAG: glycosyltransferase family 2 protein [Lachnospiraceae bacterium]|nr:glycosyltransferase family 2 protein [Lachnospiraceae bacterium]